MLRDDLPQCFKIVAVFQLLVHWDLSDRNVVKFVIKLDHIWNLTFSIAFLMRFPYFRKSTYRTAFQIIYVLNFLGTFVVVWVMMHVVVSEFYFRHGESKMAKTPRVDTFSWVLAELATLFSFTR